MDAWAGLLGAARERGPAGRPCAASRHARGPRDRRHRVARDVRVIEPQGYRTTLGLQLHAAAVADRFGWGPARGGVATASRAWSCAGRPNGSRPWPLRGARWWSWASTRTGRAVSSSGSPRCDESARARGGPGGRCARRASGCRRGDRRHARGRGVTTETTAACGRSDRPTDRPAATHAGAARRPANSTAGPIGSRRRRLARGHTVTVLARWKAGLPEREIDPAGYEIIRIRTDPGEALPGRDMARKVIRMGDRAGSEDGLEDEDGAAADEDGDDVGAPGGGVDGRVAAANGAGEAPVKPAVPPPSAPGGALLRPIRRLAGRMIRQWAILLTIRSHSRHAREVAPPADLIHGMAYMGMPVAHAIGRSTAGAGLASCTMPATSTWTPPTWPGCAVRCAG